MNWFSLPFVLTSTAYLGMGIWLFSSHRTQLQRLYGILCLATALWQAVWPFLLNSTIPSRVQLTVLNVCYTGILFIPAFFQHFIEEFKEEEKTKLFWMSLYAVPVSLTLLLWSTPWFLKGLTPYPWGLSPQAGWLHPIFCAFIAYRLFWVMRLLTLMQRNSSFSEQKRKQASWVLAATISYSAGAVDLLPNYGINLFPLSFAPLGIAMGLFAFAMFRYELFEVSSIRETEEEKSRREAAATEMRRLGLSAAFPLVSQGEVMGYLLLGEKRSEEAYSDEDLRLLRIVANQAALGCQRVRFLEMAVHGARTEMLGEIAGGFAHEIKTPLANISLPAEMSFLDLLEVEKGKRPLADILPEIKTRMKDIMMQAQKASEKIEAIRQFSKPGQVHLEPIPVETILENSLGLLTHVIEKTKTVVRVELPVVPAWVRADAKQLEIVFVNLIKNAAEAMASNPSSDARRELSLTVKEQGESIVILVKDTGPGIRRTDVGKLFEAYFTTKGSQGTGIGLFLSHQVIKAHGGSIDVSSVEGEGTTFTLHLPRAQAPQKEKAA